MIHDPARKMNDFYVKDLSHSGAMPCNLCLELAHFSLQPHRTSFIQHFPRSIVKFDTSVKSPFKAFLLTESEN